MYVHNIIYNVMGSDYDANAIIGTKDNPSATEKKRLHFHLGSQLRVVGADVQLRVSGHVCVAAQLRNTNYITYVNVYK